MGPFPPPALPEPESHLHQDFSAPIASTATTQSQKRPPPQRMLVRGDGELPQGFFATWSLTAGWGSLEPSPGPGNIGIVACHHDRGADLWQGKPSTV